MKYTYLLMAASLGLLAGCSQMEQSFADVNSLTEGDFVERVIFEVLPVKDGDDSETKASAVPTGSGPGCCWFKSSHPDDVKSSTYGNVSAFCFV